MTDRPHTVRLRTSDDRLLAAALMRETAVIGVDVDDTSLTVRTADYTALSRTVAPVARGIGCTLYEVQVMDESLEHVFAYLVSR